MGLAAPLISLTKDWTHIPYSERWGAIFKAHVYTYSEVFPGGSGVKSPPAIQELQETWIRTLGHEDPLEEGMATHSSNLAWRIPWTEEPGRLSPCRQSKESSTTKAT